MMKTITALLLSVLLLIAMAGCAKQHDETENISSQTLSQEETAEQKQQVPQQFAGKTIKESYLVRDVAFMPTFDNISHASFFVIAFFDAILSKSYTVIPLNFTGC